MTDPFDTVEHTLDEIGFVGRGRSRHRPRNDEALFGGEYPFIQTASVKAAALIIKNFDETYNEMGLAQSKLWPAGTLCITIAANIAENAILGFESCFPDSVVGFIPDPKKADVYFIKYYLDYLKLRIVGTSQGATQDNLRLEKLLRFKFKVPRDPKVQRLLIADLLAADQFAENCLERAETLEQIGDALYLEAVDASRRSDNSPTMVRLGSIAAITRVNIQPSKHPDETFLHYSMPAFDSNQLPAVDTGSAIHSNKYLISHHLVLLSKLNPHIPRIWLPLAQNVYRSIASTEFLPLAPISPYTKESIFFLCRSKNFTRVLSPRANGTSTSHQRIDPDDLQRLIVEALNPKEVETFTEKAAPVIEAAQKLRQLASVVQSMRASQLPHIFERLYQETAGVNGDGQGAIPGQEVVAR